jgi:hypothetical protein
MFIRLLSTARFYVYQVNRPPLVQFGTAVAGVVLTVSKLAKLGLNPGENEHSAGA